jgi:ribonucleoside-diphosphate reductase alpha chain
MPGLMEELKKKINRPVPELAHSTDTDLIEVEMIQAQPHLSSTGSTSGANTIKSLSDSVAHFQQDAPTCPNCGHVAVRNGACYKCLNCGESLGCS